MNSKMFITYNFSFYNWQGVGTYDTQLHPNC